MTMQNRLHHTLRQTLSLAPLIAIPLMLNVRWNDLVAANEEPKWAIFVLLGVFLTIAGALLKGLRAPTNRATTSPKKGAPWGLEGSALILFWLGLALGVTYTVNVGEGMNRLAFWSAAIVTFLAVKASIRQNPAFLDSFKAILTLSTALFSVFFWWGFFLDFHREGFNQFVQFSRIGHFNFTADALMFLIPLEVWITLAPGRFWLRGLSAFSLISCSLMLLISGSMGGMAGLLAGGLVAGAIALVKIKDSSKKGAINPRFIFLGLTLMAAALLAAKPIYDHMPAAYRDQMFVRAEWWNPPEAKALESAKSLPPLASLWMKVLPYLGARTPMWASTSGMIGDHPWRGFGTGSFLFEYPGYSKRYDLFGDFETLGVKIKTNPHNVFLQIASENGIPMAILFSGLYLWLLLKVGLKALRDRSAFWLCALWAMVAAGLDSMVNHVFFNPASLFLASISLGLFYGSRKREAHEPIPAEAPLRTSLIGSLAVIAGTLWLASFPLRWVISEYYVAEAIRLQSANPQPSQRQILSTWVDARIWSPTNIQALYGLALLSLEDKHYFASERYLQAMLKLAPNHTAGINMLATIQANTDRLDEAEQSLERALKLEPDATAIQDNLRDLRATKEASKTTPKEQAP